MELKKIGEKVAAYWGGKCLEVRHEKDGKISFLCDERGEIFFTASMTEEELSKYI